MERNYLKALKAYNRLNEDEKLSFKLMIAPETKDLELEWRELDKLNTRAGIAANLMNSFVKEDGKPYISINWIMKNIMKFSDEEIKDINK